MERLLDEMMGVVDYLQCTPEGDLRQAAEAEYERLRRKYMWYKTKSVEE